MVNPINLYLSEEGDGSFSINIHNSENFISTPLGNQIKSDNRALVELIIYELQKFYSLQIDSNNSILGDPIDKVSFYSLISTQIDYWEDKTNVFTIDEMKSKLKSDPITNLSPGPEQVDQMYQWREIIEFLEIKNYNFHEIQYFGDPEEQERLANEIALDFNKSLPFQKAIFIQLTHIFDSVISSWIFVFGDLLAKTFATIFTETAAFQKSLDYAPIEENLDDEGLYPDGTFPIEMFGKEIREETDEEIKAKEAKKLELFREIEEFSEVCRKFKESNLSLFPHDKTISNGESKTVEFKESLSLDKKKKTKEKYLEESVIKTIAGFLNSDGGELFIGISDDGEPLGIEDEVKKLHKSNDKFQLHFRNLIKHSIGEGLSSFYESQIIKIKNYNIFYVKCEKSDKEVFVKDIFYHRIGPSTDKLEGQQLIDYIVRRFKKE